MNADNLRAQGDLAKDHHMMASQLVDSSAKSTGYISACEFIGGYPKWRRSCRRTDGSRIGFRAVSSRSSRFSS